MSEKKIKALWISSWFPNRKHRLLGNFVAKQAQAVANQCDIAVVFIADDAIVDYEIEISDEDFLKIWVYYPETSNRLVKFFRFTKAWKIGLQELRNCQFKPDIVHLNILNPTGLVALYLHFFKQIPFVITEHWSGYNRRMPQIIEWHHRWLIRLCSRFSSKIIGMSPFFVESMRKNGLKGSFEVIPNIINGDVFCPSKSKKEKDVFQILHVSHLWDEHKNISGILRGIQLLSEKRRDFHLTIVGPIELHEPYIILSKTLNINHLVTFKSSLSYQETAHEMQQADLFVMLSNREGLPHVLQEALAVGIPVVVSETGGIKDWVTDEQGQVVEIGDITGFSNAIDDVLNHIDTFSVEKIRAKVAQECSNKSVSEAIIRVYENVLSVIKNNS